MSSKSLKSNLITIAFFLLLLVQVILFQKFPFNSISIALSICAGYVFADTWLLSTCKYLKLNGSQHFKGIHFHHSSFAFIGLFLAFAHFSSVSWFWVAWSMGVILQHTFDEGKLVFITRDN